MIKVLDMVASLRYGLQDMQGTRIHDHELIELINQAVAILYGRLSERYVHASLKKTTLTVTGNDNLAHDVDLPSDFVRVHQVGKNDGTVLIPTSYQPDVEGTFRIMANKFYARPGTYNFEYYYLPLRVSVLSDELDAPKAMSPYIERIALLLYRQDLAGAQNIADTCTHTLSDGEMSRFADTGPMMILGGKV